MMRATIGIHSVLLDRWLLAALGLCAALAHAQVDAQAPAPVVEAALEARIMHISSELRCLVCQNQTVAESNAALAVDFRKQIREMLLAGKSDADVTRFMVDRYGDFVLYRPPVKNTTLLLWLGPLLFAFAAGAFVFRRVTRRPAAGPVLAADDEARADALLDAARPGERT